MEARLQRCTTSRGSGEHDVLPHCVKETYCDHATASRPLTIQPPDMLARARYVGKKVGKSGPLGPKLLKIKLVEARGIEPLSEWP